MTDTSQPTDFDPRSAFLGPAGENILLLRKHIARALREVERHRRNPRTVVNSTRSPISTAELDRAIDHGLTCLFRRLDGTSLDREKLSDMERRSIATVECWSERYIGHMLADGLISAAIGRLVGDLLLQNNIAQAVSTVTTFLEHEVVATLAKIMGYRPFPRSMSATCGGEPYAGGRLTSGGTVANAEALWILREKSYAALGVFNALKDLDLLNLYNRRHPDASVRCPDDVRREFWAVYDRCLQLDSNYTKAFKDAAESYRYMYSDRFSRATAPRPVYITSVEAHYSLNKNVGLLGGAIPNDSFLRAETREQRDKRQGVLHALADRYDLWFVDTDADLRMRIDGLRGFLDRVAAQDPKEREELIVAVVPTLGTTEPCVFDPLHTILRLRDEYYRGKRLWFYVHADGAWGALLRLVRNQLPPAAREALAALPRADSITVDPHKLGYVQYPAGALLLRDRRDRAFIDVKAAYLPSGSRDDEGLQIGVASIEGSKPGSAATACWLSFLSMTSEPVSSPADATNPCDRYVPVLRRSLENAKHLEGGLRKLGFIEIVHPVEGNVICFRVLPHKITSTPAVAASSSSNLATRLLESHFNGLRHLQEDAESGPTGTASTLSAADRRRERKARSFVVTSTEIARTDMCCVRVTLMNPFLTFALIDRFAKELESYCRSDSFRLALADRSARAEAVTNRRLAEEVG